MASITTAVCTSLKKQVMEGQHKLGFNASLSIAVTSGSNVISATSGNFNDVAPGMIFTGASFPGGSVAFSRLQTPTVATVDAIAFANQASVGITVGCDNISCALIKVGFSGTYDATTTAYSQLVGNSDEVANGSGYSTGGAKIQVGGPSGGVAVSGTSAYWNPNGTVGPANPTWTSASFSTTGCIFYNAGGSTGVGGSPNQAICVESFGGTQTVTAGTFTVLLPAFGAGTALLTVS